MIIGTIGKLGTGKTLSGVIEAVRDSYYGHKIYSNIWLGFSHTPIYTPYDFITLDDCFALLDELWALVDNRRSMSILNDIITTIMLRSRKKKFNVFYTQQFLQIDVRIKFVTDYWIRPSIFPNPEIDREVFLYYLSHGLPVYLTQQIWDSEYNLLKPRVIEITPYLNLFDTTQDTYTLRPMTHPEYLKKALEKIYSTYPSYQEEAKNIQATADKKMREYSEKMKALTVSPKAI